MEKGCWFRETFSIYCPGCGGTRMIKSIFKLDFYQAFRYNPLVFIMLILMAIWTCYNVYRLINHKKIKWPSEKRCIIFAGVLILYMVLRNIPGFEFLIPTDV